LNGIFAFCFIDRVKNRFYLARDPFGVKPLYYKIEDKSLIFGSEVKPLLKSKTKIDLDHLYTFLNIRYNPSPQTLFNDVSKIKPGSYMSFDIKNELISHQFQFSQPPKKTIIYRKKKGFYTPRKEWFKGDLGHYYESLLTSNHNSFSNLINLNYVKQIFKMHRSGKVNYEKQLFVLIILFYWLEKYNLEND